MSWKPLIVAASALAALVVSLGAEAQAPSVQAPIDLVRIAAR